MRALGCCGQEQNARRKTGCLLQATSRLRPTLWLRKILSKVQVNGPSLDIQAPGLPLDKVKASPKLYEASGAVQFSRSYGLGKVIPLRFSPPLRGW